MQPPEINEQNEVDILSQALDGPLPSHDLSIDQMDHIIQAMIEDLQRDDDIRAILNNEEPFPPQQEDEGIAMDIENDDPLQEDLFW